MDWLFKQFPNYQQQGKVAYKADLENTWALMEYLDHPEQGFKSIHIGGTNGKGSSAHMLASILQEAGYKTGLYTSPHLLDFRERIKIDGRMIGRHAVLDFFKKHRTFFEARRLSFFEMTVGLAFECFRAQEVDIAIVEVGLGGRLDSTNVLTPLVAAITNIGLDHTDLLGATKEAIAGEKAGIIKTGVPVVIGEEDPVLIELFAQAAEKSKAPLVLPDRKMAMLPMDLKGSYQAKNQQLVRAVVGCLIEQGFTVTDTAVADGLQRVVVNTGLAGRWQQVATAPAVICDTAHNVEGLQWVVDQLNQQAYERLHIVFGMVSDKDVSGILALLPKDANYYFVSPAIRRSLPQEELASLANSMDLEGVSYSSVQKGYEMALKNAGVEDLVFVGGSTFVVAELLSAVASRSE